MSLFSSSPVSSVSLFIWCQYSFWSMVIVNGPVSVMAGQPQQAGTAPLHSSHAQAPCGCSPSGSLPSTWCQCGYLSVPEYIPPPETIQTQSRMPFLLQNHEDGLLLRGCNRIPFPDFLCTEVNQPEIQYLKSYFNQSNALTPLLILKIKCSIYLAALLFLIYYETLKIINKNA